MKEATQTISLRIPTKDLKALKRIKKGVSQSEALRELVIEAIQRENQLELGRRIHGKMKKSDFDERLL